LGKNHNTFPKPILPAMAENPKEKISLPTPSKVNSSDITYKPYYDPK